MRKVLGWMVLGCLALGCPAAAPPPAPPPVAVEPTPKVPMLFAHRVNFGGQTISTIAKWYTGDAANWRNLTDPVNSGLTDCCAKLRVGRVVYIPRDIVVQTKPMPYPKTVTRPAKPLAAEKPKAEGSEAAAPEEAKPEEAAPDVKGEEPTAEPPAEEPPAEEPAEEPEEEIIGPR